MTPPHDAAARASGEGAGEREELARMCETFANVVCPKLSDVLVPRGATAEGWAYAADKLRAAAAALRAARAAPEYDEDEAVRRAVAAGDAAGWPGYTIRPKVSAVLNYVRERAAALPPAGGEADARERALEEAAQVADAYQEEWAAIPVKHFTADEARCLGAREIALALRALAARPAGTTTEGARDA